MAVMPRLLQLNSKLRLCGSFEVSKRYLAPVAEVCLLLVNLIKVKHIRQKLFQRIFILTFMANINFCKLLAVRKSIGHCIEYYRPSKVFPLTFDTMKTVLFLLCVWQF